MAKEQIEAPSESGVIGCSLMSVHVLHQKRNQGLGDKEHPWSLTEFLMDLYPGHFEKAQPSATLQPNYAVGSPALP